MAQYQTRSWVGWHHPRTLVGLAHRFVTLGRKRLPQDTPELTWDPTVRLLEVVPAEPELRRPRAIALVEDHRRRNEVARRSHAKTGRAKHRGITLRRLENDSRPKSRRLPPTTRRRERGEHPGREKISAGAAVKAAHAWGSTLPWVTGFKSLPPLDVDLSQTTVKLTTMHD